MHLSSEKIFLKNVKNFNLKAKFRAESRKISLVLNCFSFLPQKRRSRICRFHPCHLANFCAHIIQFSIDISIFSFFAGSPTLQPGKLLGKSLTKPGWVPIDQSVNWDTPQRVVKVVRNLAINTL